MNLRAQSSWRAGDVARIEALIVPKLLQGAKDAGAAVLDESQAIVPVRSGELKDSGSVVTLWEGRVVTAYVQYTANHAAFIEFGTGITGRGTYPYALPQTGVPITGHWQYDYKEQNWHGMTARPYLRPALDTARQRALDAFKAALQV